MPNYELSRAADRDIQAIAHYTLETWSELQAKRYVFGLHATFQRIASNPLLGIPSAELRQGYLRRRYKSHMIFYKATNDGVLIVLVLHGQMDFTRHL